MREMFRSLPPLVQRALTIVVVGVVLLVLIRNVEALVTERVATRNTAAQRVAQTWGGAQTTAAVLLAVPMTSAVPGPEGYPAASERSVYYVLPDRLRVDIDARPERRRVGLYEMPVYLARVSVHGEFANRDLAPLLEQKPGREVHWGEARLIVLNSEARAFRAVDELSVDGVSAEASADGYAGLAGISTAMPAEALHSGAPIPFVIRLQLAGSSSLAVMPLARSTEVTMKSSWADPSFFGAPAPTQSDISSDGFSARWSVLGINRDFGQSWYDNLGRGGQAAQANLAANAIGVTFYDSVDVYQRNYRAVHYAALLIAITFLTFLLWEQIAGIAIHAVQYLMVGLALAMFYLLLLALSEHVHFDLAYGISAGALVALITAYLTGALPRRSLALGAGAGLASLYALLYWILRSEDYSLLMGTLLLFGLLSVLMMTTRRVDWTRVGRARPEPTTAD